MQCSFTFSPGCAPPPRIGQPLMLAWPDLWVRNAFERELLVERFPDVELH
jgi:hypothetical protein